MYLKGYGFLSFAKNMNKKYNQKPLDSAKTSTTDAIKLLQKEQFKKTAKATGDLIGKKISDRESVSKKFSQNNFDEAKTELEIPKERYVSPEKRQQIIDEFKVSIII